MIVEIFTKDDFEQLKNELVSSLKFHITEEINKAGTAITNKNEPKSNVKKIMRASEVTQMLGISWGTLQNLRINGTIPFSKIGGSTYYLYDDIVKLLEKTRQNGEQI